MTTILLSPSETDLGGKLTEEAIVSPLPEEHGADILIYTKQGLLGIQRKAVPSDFLASIGDGRIARETSMLPKSCKFCLLLLEGHFKYWPDGRVATGRKEPSSYTRARVRGVLFDIKYVKGVDYDYTDNLDDTVSYIKSLVQLMNKEKHFGLFTRPGGPKGTWIVPSVEETQSWVLQGFEGIGPALADSIINHFGGIPLRWACSLEELMKVPRLSAKRAKILWETLFHAGTHKEIVATNEFDRLRRMLKGD